MSSQIFAIFCLDDFGLNKKTRIYKNNENLHFIDVKVNGKLVNYNKTRNKLKRNIDKYKNKEVELSIVITSLNYLNGGIRR